MSSKTKEKDNTVKKIIFLFISIIIALAILVISVLNTTREKRNLPSLKSTKKELSVRGNIVSSDNFKITTSKKIYKASIDTRYLDKNKIELFIKLFSIYSNIPEKKVRKKIVKSLKKPGNLVLSYNIDSKTAKNLKELGFKLRKLGVFVSRNVNKGKILRGLSINESGEKRIYSYKDTLNRYVSSKGTDSKVHTWCMGKFSTSARKHFTNTKPKGPRARKG